MATEVTGLSPGFKFDPEDSELVEFFLVARLLHQSVPLDGVVIEDDPRSAPPWALLSKHGRRAEEEGFFFAEGEAVNGKAGSRHSKRTCAGGGFWQGQRLCKDGGGGKMFVGGVEIGWRKYMLSFHAPGERKTSGWVMHEYSITSPADLAASSTRLYRIRRTEHGAKKRKIRESESSDGDGRGAARMRATETEAQPVDDLLQEHHHHHPSTSAQFQPTAEIEAYYSSAGPGPAPVTFPSSDQDWPSSVADDEIPVPGTASDDGAAWVTSTAETMTTMHDGLFFMPPPPTTTMDDDGMFSMPPTTTVDDGGAFLDFEIPEDMDFSNFFTFPDDNGGEYLDDPCGGLPADAEG